MRKQLPSTGLGKQSEDVEIVEITNLEEGPHRAETLRSLRMGCRWPGAGVLAWVGVRKQAAIWLCLLLLDTTATGEVKKRGWVMFIGTEKPQETGRSKSFFLLYSCLLLSL